MKHSLKLLRCYFEATIAGDKLFEVRDNSDRGFQKGDFVELNEIEVFKQPNTNVALTGRKITAKILYVTNYGQKEDMVVFGFEVIDKHLEYAKA